MTNTTKTIIGSIVVVVLIGLGIFATVNNSTDSDSNNNDNTEQVETVDNTKEDKDIDSTTDQTEDNVDEDMVVVEENPTEETPEPSQEDSTEQQYETYTNEFFPDFELVYPSKYNLDIQKRNSTFENLENTLVILNNDEQEISLLLEPVNQINFVPEQVLEGVTPVEIANNIFEWRYEGVYNYSYSEDLTDITINSNILSESIVNYEFKNNVVYKVNIRINNLNMQPNDSSLEDVRDIIMKSTFR